MAFKVNQIYTKNKLHELLSACENKTLGEIDKNNVFARTIENPKITGIAGDVIEQSVLGYPPDIKQSPDLLVDGVPTELKTTGIRVSKSAKINKTGSANVLISSDFEAKEPMTITAVSPKTIVNEEFETSHFWEKLEHLLIVFYVYNSYDTVKAGEYRDFPFAGYTFNKFSDNDKEILKNDWLTVRNFIKKLQDEYGDECEKEYPRISHELRDQLMYIDTAPKWPHNPRFRLKRNFVSGIVRNFFNSDKEQLDKQISKFADIDRICSELTNKYKGQTIQEISNALNIKLTSYTKAIGERIVVNMFGGKVSKMNQIDVFSKAGIIGKTIILTSDNKGTEDIKLFSIDFDEIKDPTISFEESSFYNYFNEQIFLCIIFQEPEKSSASEKIPLKDNKFVGFRKLAFSEEFITTEVERTWNEIRDLVINNKLKLVPKTDKDGKVIVNKKTGLPSDAPNFPKSKTNSVFVRGSGVDSSKKTLKLNGLSMYDQYIWIKRKAFLDFLLK